jgi:hypothetical protein
VSAADRYDPSTEALIDAECQQAGGGIHCSTLPLVRDRS